MRNENGMMSTDYDITKHLRDHFLNDIGVAVSVVTAENWAALPTSRVKRIGLYGPLPYPDPSGQVEPPAGPVPPLIVFFSPEYIAVITAPEHFDTNDGSPVVGPFCDVLCYLGDMMIALNEEFPDEAERFTQVEEMFFEECPTYVALLNAVELVALDLELAERDE